VASACRAADVGASKGALLGTVAASALLVAAATRAQNELDVAFHAFQDSRGVTVLSPETSFTKDFTDRTAVRLKFGLDAISAASDSCARCHPQGVSNSRVVTGVSVLRKYGDTKLTVGGEFSKENFYTATTGLTSISRDFNKSNTTVAAGFSYSFNQPELHPDRITESQRAADAFANVTQSWTKSTVTQIGYELEQINGYQTNPFLRTIVDGVWTLGNHPDARTRQALTARIRQALPAETFLELDYRRYHDTWAVDSNAISIGLSHHFSDRVTAGGTYRWYDQTGAYFYAPSYTGSPQYYTGDFRLFPFDSDLYTGHLDITPKNGLWHMPPGTALTLQYERYVATTGFEAGIFTGGFRIPLK
jgi:Protein of unknown function (DUF3570)